ncbi:MAG: sigma-70 family RNA polymerase sigma factor [Saprospiraceae bacterium]|jgi:RNA polymerase sigma factor (sigma-70 family)|nr:sigma-70 family RNA polymerase sigma factor [Saprospiraceae bacterium]
MDWIARIKSDPDKTLAMLYQNYKADAVGWIKTTYQLDGGDAEEIFQTSIVLLYDNVVTGKLTILTADIKTYIFSIIKNKIIHHNRAKSKTIAYDASEIIRDTVEEEYQETSKEDLDKAAKALLHIGEPCKSLLELSYYQQMKLDDITVIMNYKNNDTTKNLKYKCMKRLQKIFFGYI